MARFLQFMIAFCVVLMSCFSLSAQFIDFGVNRVVTPLKLEFRRLGTLTPRATHEIDSSFITVGCETLDRDFARFDEYKAYLPYLGAKKIRLQAGWAKTERKKGIYDWRWLDEIMDFAVANKISPWLELSYGNPIYDGGGGTGLLNSLMSSEEAYNAWDKWVEAIVFRYKGKVKEWEIWNEPDHPMQSISPETIAALNLRTAQIIKRIDPGASIAGLAFASHTDVVYLERFLKYLHDRNGLDLFRWISYHSYAMRPEDSYHGVAKLQEVVRRYSPRLVLRQGENGAPSTFIPSFALDKYYWTEYSQAKYNLRRMIGDLARGIETAVFTIIDLNYRGSNPVLNTKGLIQSDTSGIAIRPKVAFYSVQNVAALFDATVLPDTAFAIINKSPDVTAFRFTQKSKGLGMVVFWDDHTIPGNRFQTRDVSFTLQNANVRRPILVDLLSGHVFRVPAKSIARKDASTIIVTLPAYDSPMLLTEEDLIRFQKVR